MFSIGQAVRLRSGSAWEKILSANALGVIVGMLGNDRYQVAFPTGDGRPPLVGEFSSAELVSVQQG
jgi:hypothetical protein